jgi:hypothetical protein
LLVLGALLFSGCAGERWVRTRIQDNKDLSVFLEHAVADDQIKQMNFDHPCNLSMSDMEILLRGMQFSEKSLFGRPDITPVFTDQELLSLVPALTRALARADENQRVRFTTADRGSMVVFGGRQYTEGILFIEKGEIMNIALAYINRKPDLDESNSLDPTPDYPNPLSVHSSNNPLMVQPGYRHRPSDWAGKPYPLWVMIEMNRVLVREEEMAAPVPEEVVIVPVVVEEAEPQVTTDPGAKTTAAPEKVEVQAAESQAATAAPKPEAPLDKEAIMTKLKLLKELFDEGLIDEEEYKTKKKEYLDKL